MNLPVFASEDRVRNEKQKKTVEVIDKKFEFVIFLLSLSKKSFPSLRKTGSYFNSVGRVLKKGIERKGQGGRARE